jgi:hypothetical protein
VPRGVPYCKIAFDPENDLWYFETWCPGNPVHNQACVYPTIEASQLAVDPQRERVPASLRADERTYAPFTSGTAWRAPFPAQELL